ncbi:MULTISPECIES: tetratricopeptide repeat protein [unclassified Novosphingobium]|uniref:tetratricopeptide repeat protein n=1 Tax=unclassified Novosphingobium TaxID=2644732 RepID=UPI00146C961A|nr:MULTISPECIES: tetratricopeptide repeat protein [unclassified Novosphingobium]NMN06112.1 cytochrome c-type biogenesis protein CcmH [Novosphingobium sp. SG919]NMN88409.1 cytochrome c-type biogenesis protein CcmH [Novosphingobium sp. SG916]
MTWVLVLAVAGVAFAAMVLIGRLPRTGWEVTGAALLFGLAGYALQGHPGLPGAPTPAVENAAVADATLLKERQQMGNSFAKGRSWLILADGLTRQGQYRAAADVLGKAARENPDDADVEVALGNALVGHSEGLITPAAQYAFRRAAAIDPNHPGPPFFMGLALAQSGRLVDARAMWADLLARSPADAPYRPDLAARLERLDQMIAASGGAPAASGEPAPAPAAPAPASGKK